jgi:hypothetical protein
MAKKGMFFCLLFILTITTKAHTNGIPKRKKTIICHNFNGAGVIVLFGGTRGKYFKVHRIVNNHAKLQVHISITSIKKITKEIPLPMPSLKIDFIGGTDKYRDSLIVDSIIKPLAIYLVENNRVKITLTGNTGGGDFNVPEGKGKKIYCAKTSLNYKPATFGMLMKARAGAVKKYLANNYGINPKRIKTCLGTNKYSEENRTVGVSVTKNLLSLFHL